MEIWRYLAGGIVGLLVPSLFYLGKQYIDKRIEHSVKHKYEKELETHKANLQRDYDVQLERLRAELAEKQFRFSHVFEKTAEAIVEIHRKLLRVSRAADIVLETSKETDIKPVSDWVDELKAFHPYYAANRMYVPKATRNAIDGLLLSQNQAIVRVETEPQAKQLREELRLLRERLEDDFQRILGFPIEAKDAQNEPKSN